MHDTSIRWTNRLLPARHSAGVWYDLRRWHNSHRPYYTNFVSFCRHIHTHKHTMSHRSRYYIWLLYVFYANRSVRRTPVHTHTHTVYHLTGRECNATHSIQKKKWFDACVARARCEWFPYPSATEWKIERKIKMGFFFFFFGCEKWKMCLWQPPMNLISLELINFVKNRRKKNCTQKAHES